MIKSALSSAFVKAPGFILIILLSLVLFSCSQNKKKVKIDEAVLNEQLLEANKNLLQTEKYLIDSFIQKHGYEMKATGTGLRYQIIDSGRRINAEVGDEVMIRYKALFLDGTLCDESPKETPLTFRIGEGKQIKGVEEALLLIPEEGTARLIVPTHLAYGLRGDGANIPPAAILYYEIKLLAIKR
jgi:FKBP-type peptidyl-prolyl cis-trans isomerase